MKNITNKTKTILFASLIAAMIFPFSTMDFAQAAPNENANENAKKYTKAQVIEEIDRRVSDLNDKLATDASNERLVDSKQSYLIGKKIIQIQLNMETASDKELEQLGEKLVKNLEKLEKLNEKYDAKITKTSVNETNVLEELFAPQMAHAVLDSWILQQSRSECGTTYASTYGSMEGFTSSSSWHTTNNYPSSIGVGNFPNCDTEYFDHSTTKFFKLGLGLCWHDISTPSGSWSEDCSAIQSGDLVVVEIQGYYGSGWIKTWYNSVPMVDILWL